jgi:hypothetical protein
MTCAKHLVTTIGFHPVPTMTMAHRLYRILGFSVFTASRANPVHGASYLELSLR